MPIETFDFINARGSRLSGKIEAPEVTPRGWGGLGNSDGDFAEATFSADVSDLVMAASAMGEAGNPDTGSQLTRQDT